MSTVGINSEPEVPCCPQQIGEGCWTSGTTIRRWVSLRDADGTVTLRDTVTGAVVAPATVSACAEDMVNQTTLAAINGTQTYAVPGTDLVSWSVRVQTGTVNLDVNGNVGNFTAGAVIESAAESGATLDDAISVMGGAAGGLAYVTHVNRV